MSFRVRFIASLLATSLLSVAVVGLVAHQRLVHKFDALVLEHAARNFRGDVASYWLTYGSWDAGVAAEPFRHFVQRRKALLHPRGAGEPFHFSADTGDAFSAEALPPWRGPSEEDESPLRFGGEGPRVDPRLQPASGAHTPPFRFLLFDTAGRILNPPREAGRPVSRDEQEHAVPIAVRDKIVAFASPIGFINYSPEDRAYMDAVSDAMVQGIAAAAGTAVAFGLLVGHRLSRSLRRLTRAVESMQGGSLRQHVPIESRDELGLLARAFNAMSEQLALSHDALAQSHRTISDQAERLRAQALSDPLTELHNRRHFDEQAGKLFDQAERYGRPLAIVMVDVDHFKRINDRHSHNIGDLVLRELAGLLRRHLRGSDVVARYGGEEFTLALPETTLDEAIACCERLRGDVMDHDWSRIHPELAVTVSIGVAGDLLPGGIEAMLAAADRHLYRAKAAGRNCIRSARDADSVEAPPAPRPSAEDDSPDAPGKLPVPLC